MTCALGTSDAKLLHGCLGVLCESVLACRVRIEVCTSPHGPKGTMGGRDSRHIDGWDVPLWNFMTHA